MTEIFTGSFTQQEPIPEEGIAAALDVLRHGRLHRYNTAPGEIGHAALLEEEFAALTGARFCVAVASGGYAMATALRALGVGLVTGCSPTPSRWRRCRGRLPRSGRCLCFSR